MAIDEINTTTGGRFFEFPCRAALGRALLEGFRALVIGNASRSMANGRTRKHRSIAVFSRTAWSLLQDTRVPRTG